MQDNKELLLSKLSDCVLNMEDEQIVDVAKEYINKGYPALDGVLYGLLDGMQRAAKLFEEEEYYIPEILICSETMYNGLNVIKPYVDNKSFSKNKKIVIGVVEGDNHDIGKNLVRIMLEVSGYTVIDLGSDVPCQDFIDKAIEVKADLIAMSSLMSSTMDNMYKVIELLKKQNIRNEFKVIIGGAPISSAFADKIGADGYSSNAIDAVKLVDKLI